MQLGISLTALGLVSASLIAALVATPEARAGEGPSPEAERSMRSVVGEIDDFVAITWEREGLEPNARCSDSEYVRRVFLDVVGTVPTPKQVREFVADDRIDKRARLVDDLLESPGYARHAANQWGATLVGSADSQNAREYVGGLFRSWLEEQFAANRPFGEMGREMLTSDGTVYTNPALNFMGRRNHDPKDLAGSVSRVFMGVQIQCAQCHDHPYENITQRDFQGMAAFFARMTIRREQIPYDMFGKRAMERAEKRYDNDVKKLVAGGASEEQARMQAEKRRPKSMKIGDIGGHVRLPKRYRQRMEKRVGELSKTAPKFLAGDVYEDTDGETRREALANWVFDTGNASTARALANRYWYWYFGRGFVHPVDDFNSVNIPSVPEALESLARDVAAHDFDLKRLIRVITRTQAYQLTTSGGERTPHAQEFFAVGPLKPLSPQVSFDSLQVALGVTDNGTSMSGLDGRGGMSALEMGRGNGGMMSMGDEKDRNQRLLRGAARNFFQTFDDDEGGESESFEGTIPQGLFLMNSQVVNGLLTNPRISIVPKVMQQFDTRRDRIRHLFLRTLSREPTPKELRDFETFVKKHAVSLPDEEGTGTPKSKRKARRKRFARRNKEAANAQPYADILWTLISTSEFGTNH